MNLPPLPTCNYGRDIFFPSPRRLKWWPSREPCSRAGGGASKLASALVAHRLITRGARGLSRPALIRHSSAPREDHSSPYRTSKGPGLQFRTVALFGRTENGDRPGT